MIKQVLKAVVPLSARRLFRCAEARIINSTGKLYCPVCDSRIARFEKLPRFYYEQMDAHGFDYRSRKGETCNVAAYSCPLCGASDRDRLYALYLKHVITGPMSSTFSLLDIAPSRPLSDYIRRNFPIRYKTADLLMEGVDDRVDITDMRPYGEESFDAFICSHVLEHVADDRKAMKELFRILKPDGWGICMVPIQIGLGEIYERADVTLESERWKHFGQGDHVRTYSREGFLDRLQAAGFSTQLLTAVDLGGNEVLRHCGIAVESVLYIALKERSSVRPTVR